MQRGLWIEEGKGGQERDESDKNTNQKDSVSSQVDVWCLFWSHGFSAIYIAGENSVHRRRIRLVAVKGQAWEIGTRHGSNPGGGQHEVHELVSMCHQPW